MDIVQPWQRLVAFSSLLLAVVAGGFILRSLDGILLPFVLAGFLSIVFKPLVHRLRTWRIPMPVVMLVVLLLSAGALWLIYLIISLGVDQFISTSDFYIGQLAVVRESIESSVGSALNAMGSKGSFHLGSVLTPEAATQFATAEVGTLLAIVSDGVMVLLYLLFMLGASEAFPGKIASAFKGGRANIVWDLFETLNTRVRTYLVMKTVFNLINAVVAYVILLIFGVDFAPLIALLTFLFHYIPNIGSLFTTILPTLIYMLQTGSVPQALILALILIVVQNVIGNVIEPKVMGDRLELSPVVVLFSLLFWGWMWGIVGMILSIPIMSSLKALLETIPSTRPIAILMGSEASPPVVTPPTT